MATALDRLKQAREDLILTLATEQAYCAAHGPKPDYSLDDESYQWSAWEEAALRKIESFNRLIQQEQPVWVVSRGRS